MLALRDQENLVHAHQTVAASKPLNQGVKQLQTKTPGARAPKTPFKIPLSDENDPLAFGKKTLKATGKQNENVKPSAKDAFVTPLANPRSRAPLGMKTTNAKAKGVQTPAAPAGTVKPERTTKRGSTQKVKKFAPLVDQSQTKVQEKPAQDDVPDIEYMPPKPKELSDIPDEITYDTTFPQFQAKNLALGLESVYGDNEIGSDGLTKRERKLQEDSVACDKMMDEMILKQIESIGFEDASEARQRDGPSMGDISKPRRMKATTSRVKYTSNVSTVRARDAAAALSGADRSARTRQVAIPKARPRVTSALFSSRKPRSPPNPSSMRHTAATASSRTTLGYAKGRDVSSKLRGKSPNSTKQSLSKGILSPETYMEPNGPTLEREPGNRFPGAENLDHEEDQLPIDMESMLPTYEEDEEARNFQLTL
ncbi:hypothetical protein EYZ11_001194 [Aspergillus tanneri]|uniref:Uncharacterized protein n=1 Tax=Aspergillus tanneri TaxID=1220188 RepID=A0A4S3JV43_9EURO|nr:uncharacterized protein ATNIH1004_011062 [Aspergillus tanneri]KAA8642121.1 hypothetical protein ATNIH1004_011062 [Aspergillus tanneri]THC99288.1 hypothetical protein EYZ11_001194 [Aspergillus tanneri]